MEPIISPWFFYFAGMCNLILLFSGIGWVISMFAFFAMLDQSKKIKVPAIAMTIFFALLVLVPREETCYKMMVASLVTPNNVKMLEGKVNDTADKLLEKIVKTAKEIKDGADN